MLIANLNAMQLPGARVSGRRRTERGGGSGSPVAIVIKSQYARARQLSAWIRTGYVHLTLLQLLLLLLLLLIDDAGPGHFNDLLNLNHLYWQQSRCEFVTFS